MSVFGRLLAPSHGFGYVTYKIDGLKELDERLTAFGPMVAKRIGNLATRKGAQLIRDEAIRNAGRFNRGYATGFLQKNIIQFRPRRRRGQLLRITNEMNVGVRLKGKGSTRAFKRKGRVKQYPAYYWFMVEYGTKKMAAQSFMRTAFESKVQEAQDVMIKTLRQGIERENRKQARKAAKSS